MTAKETLAKYGLKTDVKSIRERVFANNGFNDSELYFEIADKFTNNDEESEHITLRLINADLALLCKLAEKGERYEKAVKNHRDELEPHRCMDEYAFYAVKELTEIITEAEGEPK